MYVGLNGSQGALEVICRGGVDKIIDRGWKARQGIHGGICRRWDGVREHLGESIGNQ